MNIDKAIERIARNNSADEIHKWEEGIAKRQDALHEAAFGILNKVCDAVNALTDRTRAIARKARNLQGKIAYEEWKKERGGRMKKVLMVVVAAALTMGAVAEKTVTTEAYVSIPGERTVHMVAAKVTFLEGGMVSVESLWGVTYTTHLANVVLVKRKNPVPPPAKGQRKN